MRKVRQIPTSYKIKPLWFSDGGLTIPHRYLNEKGVEMNYEQPPSGDNYIITVYYRHDTNIAQRSVRCINWSINRGHLVCDSQNGGSFVVNMNSIVWFEVRPIITPSLE